MNQRIAVLIDAENTSVKYVDTVMKESKQYGDISVNRMYGDFADTKMSEWTKKGLEYAIVPIHQGRRNIAAKNASDIMLVIDAMDILYQGIADVFCIVTSDSDFTRLASRLREGGKKVIGMGKSDASKTFITACNEYKYLDKISEDEDTEESNEKSSITPLSEIKASLNYMLQQAESSGEKLNLGSAKSSLQREYADFDERNYGYSLFRKFIEEDTKFVVEINGSTAYIKRKNADKKQNNTDDMIEFIKTKAAKGVELGTLGKELIKKYPNFKYKEQGYSKLSKYIESIPGIEIKKRNNQQIVKNK